MCFSHANFSPSHFVFAWLLSEQSSDSGKRIFRWYFGGERKQTLSMVSSSLTMSRWKEENNSHMNWGRVEFMISQEVCWRETTTKKKSKWRHRGKWTIYEWKRSGSKKKNMGAGEAKRNSEKTSTTCVRHPRESDMKANLFKRRNLIIFLIDFVVW